MGMGQTTSHCPPPFPLGLPQLDQAELTFHSRPQLACLQNRPKEFSCRSAQCSVSIKVAQLNAKSMYCRAPKGSMGHRKAHEDP
eukprot:6938760-Pyramimonas_sp.AAC.1